MKLSESVGIFKGCGTITEILIILKLFKLIDWSWWGVFSPTFAQFFLGLFFWAIINVIYGD